MNHWNFCCLVFSILTLAHIIGTGPLCGLMSRFGFASILNFSG